VPPPCACEFGDSWLFSPLFCPPLDGPFPSLFFSLLSGVDAGFELDLLSAPPAVPPCFFLSGETLSPPLFSEVFAADSVVDGSTTVLVSFIPETFVVIGGRQRDVLILLLLVVVLELATVLFNDDGRGTADTMTAGDAMQIGPSSFLAVRFEAETDLIAVRAMQLLSRFVPGVYSFPGHFAID